MFESLKKRVQQSYFKRAEQLYQSLEKYILQDGVFEPIIRSKSICMNAHVLLIKKVNLNQVIKNLRSQGILLESIKNNYLPGIEQERILKFNVSNTDEMKINQGIQLVVREANNRRNWFLKK